MAGIQRLHVEPCIRHLREVGRMPPSVDTTRPGVLRFTDHYDRARGNPDRSGVHFLTVSVAGV